MRDETPIEPNNEQKADGPPGPSDDPLPHLKKSTNLPLQTYHFKTIEEGYRLAENISSYCPNPQRKKLELGLKELFFNAIEHGNLGITFEEKLQLKKTQQWYQEYRKRLDLYGDRKVEVNVEITTVSMTVHVKDEGEGFDWRKLDLSTTKTMNPYFHGRGLMLAKQVCFDKLTFSEKGNEVHCMVLLSKQKP